MLGLNNQLTDQIIYQIILIIFQNSRKWCEISLFQQLQVKVSSYITLKTKRSYYTIAKVRLR